MKDYKLKDNGTEVQFTTGAKREGKAGKGRFDLIPPIPLKRLAAIYEKGAAARGDRNWEKGLPMHSYLDSAFRHLVQYIQGMNDEDHLAQSAWNLFGAMHTEQMIEWGKLPKELDDMPDHTEPAKECPINPIKDTLPAETSTVKEVVSSNTEPTDNHPIPLYSRVETKLMELLGFVVGKVENRPDVYKVKLDSLSMPTDLHCSEFKIVEDKVNG